MHLFIKGGFIIFRSLLLLSSLAFHPLAFAAINVDNLPIENSLKRGEKLSYNLPDNVPGFKLSYKEGNFSAYKVVIDKKNLKEFYQTRLRNLKGCATRSIL